MKLGKIDVIVMTVTVVTFAALVGPTLPGGRFAYDEADYMYAVSRGFTANYLDQPTIPFTTFVRRGLGQGMKESGRSSLSEFIRASDDIAFYRHFHAPLYYYWVILHTKLLGRSERAIRWASLDCLMLAYIAAYVGCLSLAKQRPRATAVLASSLLLFSPSGIATTRLITPHGLYVATVIVSLAAMATLINTGNARDWYLSLAAVTLSMLTLEYAVLLVVTLVVCAFIRRRELFAGSNRAQVFAFVARSVGLVVGIVAVAWPAGLFKLTIVKNYIFFTYFSLVRAKSFGTASPWTIWSDRITTYPVEFGILVVGLVIGIVLLVRRRLDRWLLPFAVYGCLMLLTTVLNRSPELTYISSLIAALVVIASAAVIEAMAPFRPAVGTAITTAIVASVALAAFPRLRERSGSTDLSNVVVDLVARTDTTRARVAIPGVFLPTVHYYFRNVAPTVYEQTAECGDILDLTTSMPLDAVICRGAGQDSLRRRLEAQYDVSVDRLGSAEQRRELVLFRLARQNGR